MKYSVAISVCFSLTIFFAYCDQNMSDADPIQPTSDEYVSATDTGFENDDILSNDQNKKTIIALLRECFRNKNFPNALRVLKRNKAVWNSTQQRLSDTLSPNLKLKIYNYLAVLSAKENFHDEASTFYELAIEQIQKTNDPHQLLVLLENRMASLVRIHQVQKAEEYYKLICALYKKMPEKYPEIPYSVKNNMGTNYFFSGDYENALKLHKEAADKLLQNAKKRKIKENIQIFYNVAWDYCASGNIQEAIHYLTDVKKYIPKKYHRFLESRLLYLKAMILPLNNVKDEILNLEKKGPLGQNEIKIFLDLAKAEIAKREHRWKDVAENLIRSLKLQHPDYLKFQQVKELPPGIQSYKARCAAIAEAFAKAKDPKKAWVWIQYANLRAEKELDMKGNISELADIMSVERKLEFRIGKAQEVVKLEQKYEQAKSRLKKANPVLWKALFSERINLHPDDLDGIRHDLPSGAVLLESAVIGENIVFFICERDHRVQMVLSPLPKAERKVKQLIMRFRQQISSVGDITSTKELCNRLYTILFKPVETEIEKRNPKIILYSPTGILRYIPIAALHTGKSYLCEKYLFCNLSGYDLRRIKQEDQNKPLERFVGFSNPDGSLPASEAECEAISHLFAQPTVWSQREATKDRFLNLSGEIDCLHVATHGKLDPSQPEKSCIIFADQSLNYTEMVAGVPFMKRLYMLTFSACDTASIPTFLNENAMEIYGMAYQFVRKTNTGATLATLWPISDSHTKKMMEKFYRTLISGHKNHIVFNRAAALHTAQLFLLHNPETAHPFYWAPFILIGNFN